MMLMTKLFMQSGDMIKKVVDILGYQWHELTKEVGD